MPCCTATDTPWPGLVHYDIISKRHNFRNLTFLDLAFPVSFPIYRNTAMFKIHKKNFRRCRSRTYTYIYMSMITNIEERIAEEVRKNPHLYNTPLKDYKDARITANSAAVELDTKDCVMRWRRLRDKFVRAKQTS